MVQHSFHISRSVVADIDFVALQGEVFKGSGKDFWKIFRPRQDMEKGPSGQCGCTGGRPPGGLMPGQSRVGSGRSGAGPGSGTGSGPGDGGAGNGFGDGGPGGRGWVGSGDVGSGPGSGGNGSGSCTGGMVMELPLSRWADVS